MTAALVRPAGKGLAWLVLCALALGSCGQAAKKDVPCASRDLLALAAQHYRAHNGPETLKLIGGKLSYFFEDEGDRWSVTVAPYRNLRRNTLLSIRKSDRKVRLVEMSEPRQDSVKTPG